LAKGAKEKQLQEVQLRSAFAARGHHMINVQNGMIALKSKWKFPYAR